MDLPKIKFEKEDINDHKLYAQSKVTELVNYRDSEFATSPYQWQFIYLDLLITEIENICTAEDIDSFKILFDNIHIFDFSKCRCKKGNANLCLPCSDKRFSLKLQSILGYNHNSLVKYFLYNGNKTCYICNAQYTLVAQKDYIKKYNGGYRFKSKYKKLKKTYITQSRNKAKFQLDHYYPKSLYPVFSISLHNLFPICGPCNQVKSNSLLDIKKLHKNSKFVLQEDTIYSFYKSRKRNDLILNIDDIGTDGLVSKFDLKGIYDNHIDYVEELLTRKINYSNSYKTALLKKHPDITPTFTSIEDRLIVGTYDKSEGIYKRPLSKLLQDLNDQLDDYVK